MQARRCFFLSATYNFIKLKMLVLVKKEDESMKTNRPQKIVGYTELFVKLHVLTKEQKKDIMKFIKIR